MSKTALFSLYDTTQVTDFARTLVGQGWKIIASRETIEVLAQERIPCEDVSAFTGVGYDYGFPPTLHPRIEYALTMDDPENRIDLVYVISYPLEIGNDVGGRVMLALAAKGKRLPVMSREDMEKVIEVLKTTGTIPDDLRAAMIDKTNASIASHYLKLVARSDRDEYASHVGQFATALMNGENPYQTAEVFAVETGDPLALPKFKLLSGTLPCFTNLADVDSLLNTLCLAAEASRQHYGKQPYITVASKHGNVCGMSIDWNDPLACVEKALFGNPLAVWGGELMTNFPIDNRLAEKLTRHPRREELFGTASWMLDVVIAPAYNENALEMLLKRKFRKVLQNPALADAKPLLSGHSFRWVRGGFIRQSPPWRVLNIKEAEATTTQLEDEDMDNLIIAWSAAYTSFHGGNEVALVTGRQLLGVGGGPATVQAAQMAVERAQQAGHDIKGSVFCADAFFPFTDAPEILINAGVKMGCVPAGGKNEHLVREAFASHNIPMFYLPEDFRGFCRH